MSIPSHSGDTAAATVLRYVDWKLSEREEIYAPDPVDYLATPVGGKVAFRIMNLCISAALAFDRLLLAVSANLATEALQLARLRYGNHSPMSTFPATLLAQVAYEQGRFEDAEDSIAATALSDPRLRIIRVRCACECAPREILVASGSAPCRVNNSARNRSSWPRAPVATIGLHRIFGICPDSRDDFVTTSAKAAKVIHGEARLLSSYWTGVAARQSIPASAGTSANVHRAHADF